MTSFTPVNCFAMPIPDASRATKQPDGQINKSLSTPPSKNIPLNASGKSALRLRASHPMKGAGRDRHERAVGCGGRAACARRTQAARTAKPCGPGAPMLASSSRENFSRATVARKPVHRGEHGISRKPLRRESRIASAEPVCSCALFSSAICARDRGCSAHPAFPAPSCSRGWKVTQSPDASRRGNADAYALAV